MEKIQEYIKDNELVNKYDLSEKVFELYQNDINNGKNPFVDKNYMETLVYRTYNHKINEGYIPNGVEIEPEIYDDKYKEITHKIDEE